MNQPLRKSGTWGKLARNGQMLYNCWEIRLIAALLLTFMSHMRPVPSPQGDLVG